MAGDNAAAWTAAASAPPGADTLQLLADADPLGLPPSALVDLIVTAGRLISHVQALQIAAVAEFARPGRCGDLEKLLAGLTERVGLAHRADGSVDPEKMAVLAEEQARRVATAEIAAALRQSHQGVARRVNEALELVDELPDTLAAVRDGRIDLARAGAIAARTRNLPAPDRQKVEAQVIKLAETRCPGKLNPLIDRRVLKIDADAVNKRCRAARRDRFVDHTAGVDGMGDIRAHLPAEGALTVWDLLDRIARATAGQDERPLGVRRADALTDICTQLLTTGRCDLGADSAPNSETSDEASSTASADTDTGTDTGTDTDADADTEVMVDVPAPFRRERVAGKRLSKVAKFHGRGAHFVLSMTVDAFLGLSDDPAELDGHGPMPAAYGRWMRKSLQSLAVVVVNEHGHAVGVGGTVYPPRQQVTDQVITAAGTCRFPSCRIPAANCDLDHRVPFDHLHPERGGSTDPTNLDPACENHHLLKTFTGWTPERDTTDGASMRWTSPTGHTYLDPAKEHTLPDHDRDALTSPPDGEDPDTADPNRDDDYDLDDWTILPSHLDQSTAQIQAQSTPPPTLTELESKRANDIWEKFHVHVIRPPQTCGRVGWLQDPTGDPGHSDAKNHSDTQNPRPLEARQQRQLVNMVRHAIADARRDPNEPPF